jgi:hypothetical protein
VHGAEEAPYGVPLHDDEGAARDHEPAEHDREQDLPTAPRALSTREALEDGAHELSDDHHDEDRGCG